MIREEVEWEDEKAAANVQRHGVAFDQAVRALGDPFAVEWIDDREDYGEERSASTCSECAETSCCTSPILSGAHGFGSFRRDARSGMSKTTTIVRMRADGALVEVQSDGTVTPLYEAAARPM